ncbi:MAG: hypothetical protein KJO41_06305 [Bacteroidia bacterium]|nr:hypothetical protein [Bacteroidia bacterium]NND24984.1 hypothetical protein [Flavobacteriaceae bacterium]MBT8278596.1 hypothetical protein [Bacteroidia bacterium]NNK59510.1 hypothetical protein [Flavobacteriaceae bacterium]NNL32622.1 hypothetical protein [Flavobacteriaceae bacterium]
MTKYIIRIALIFFVSISAFSQQKDIEFKIEDNDKTLSVICFNNSEVTQEVVLTLKEVKGLKGYSKPITKTLAPKSKINFIDLTYDYVYSYKLAYSKKPVITSEEKTKKLKEKNAHLLEDYTKINEGIVIFDDTECTRCSFATNFMMENNIDFKIVDISKNEENLKLMWKTIREKGLSLKVKTPVIMVNGEVSHSHNDLQQFLEGLK